MIVAIALHDFTFDEKPKAESTEKTTEKREQSPPKQNSDEETKNERQPEQNDKSSLNDQDHKSNIKQSEQQMSYLTFKQGDRIVVKYQSETGWWWGCLLGVTDPKDGYFPSTFVKFSHQLGNDDETAIKKDEDIEKMDWNQYARHMKNKAQQQNQDSDFEAYLKDNEDKQEENLERFLHPGIKGYKKVKIDPQNQASYKNISGSFFSKEGDTVFIPIKSQDPLNKACRQLNYYFDYDKWNEQMNTNRPQKHKSSQQFKNKPTKPQQK